MEDVKGQKAKGKSGGRTLRRENLRKDKEKGAEYSHHLITHNLVKDVRYWIPDGKEVKTSRL